MKQFFDQSGWNLRLTSTLAPPRRDGLGAREFSAALQAARPGHIRWDVLEGWPCQSTKSLKSEALDEPPPSPDHFATFWGRHRKEDLAENPPNFDPLRSILDRGFKVSETQWSELDMISDPEVLVTDGWVCDDGPWYAWNTPWHMVFRETLNDWYAITESTPHAVFESPRSFQITESPDQTELDGWNKAPEALKLLLKYGADVNVFNARGCTMLHELIMHSHNGRFYRQIKYLVRNGADVNCLTKKSEPTTKLSKKWGNHLPGGSWPLLQAFHVRDLSTMTLLIDVGADVNHRSDQGWSVVDYAIASGFSSAIDLLLTHGAILPEANTSEQLATFRPDRETARILLGTTHSELSEKCLPLYKWIFSLPTVQDTVRGEHSPSNLMSWNLATAFVHELATIAKVPNPTVINERHCTRCAAVQGPEGKAHWPTYDSLKVSAREGCPLCGIFLDTLNSSSYNLGEVGNGLRVSQYHQGLQIWAPGDSGGLLSNIDVRLLPDDMMDHWDEVGEDLRPGSFTPAACQLAKNWLSRCRTVHSYPQGQIVSTELPSRVIKVGLGDEHPRLFITNGAQGRYCALSYCWGGSSVFKTTRASISALTRGLPMNSLPRTIREAIYVAKALEIPYIWVDSLCIVQDDPKDWSREAARMGDIYTNAELTIAATDSPDANDGIFGKKLRHSPHTLYPVKLRLQNHVRELGKSCNYAMANDTKWKGRAKGPLNNRGWTLQEELLSPRILFFSDGVIHWECQHASCSGWAPDEGLERLSKDSEEHQATRTTRDLLLNSYSTAHSSMKGEKFDDASARALWLTWSKIVADYTSRKLTKRTDKIPAIVGITQRLEPRMQGKFISGFWPGPHAIRSLTWERAQPYGDANISHPRDPNSPSWSWTSMNSAVTHMPFDYRVYQGVEVSLQLLSRMKIRSLLEEQILDGDDEYYRYSLMVSGFVRPVSRYMLEIFRAREAQDSQRKATDDGFRCGNARQTIYSRESPGRVVWDRKPPTSTNWVCLVLGQLGPLDIDEKAEGNPTTSILFARESVDIKRPASVTCLCIQPLRNEDTKYRRIGICELEDNDQFWDGTPEKKKIVLV